MTWQKFQRLNEDLYDKNITVLADTRSWPEYRDIVSMGKIAIPWIYEELLTDPQWHHFNLLQDITGETINIDEKDKGTFEKIVACYIKDGRKRGYLK